MVVVVIGKRASRGSNSSGGRFSTLQRQRTVAGTWAISSFYTATVYKAVNYFYDSIRNQLSTDSIENVSF